MPHQIAVFVKSGRVAETYAEGRHTVSGQSTPFLTGITKMFTGGVDPYLSMLYFINTFDQTGMRWGTSDPIQIPIPGMVSARSNGLSIPAGAHGQYSVALAYDRDGDPQRNSDRLQAFLEQFVFGHDEVARRTVADLVRQRVNMVVRDQMSKVFLTLGLPINQIDGNTALINDAILRQLQASGVFDEFERHYGLRIFDFVTDAVVIDKGSQEYRTYEKRANAYEDKASNAESDLYETDLNMRGSRLQTDAKAYDQTQRGYTYQQERTMDVLQAAASNTGSGSDLLNGGVGLGVGLGAASAISNSLGKAISDAAMNTNTAAQAAGQQATASTWQSAGVSAQQPAAAPAAASEPPSQPAPASEQTAAESQRSAAPADDPVAALTKLKQLHDLHLISDDQFAAKQQEILSRL